VVTLTAAKAERPGPKTCAIAGLFNRNKITLMLESASCRAGSVLPPQELAG
jgi:hypothetical protein